MDYDMIIIGAGPAGLSAAIYASRSGYQTAVLEKIGPGGQMMLTDMIDNYPAFPEGVSGFELQDRMQRQALRFGAKFLSGEVLSLRKEGDSFLLRTTSGDYQAGSVIIASGASHRTLGVKGEAPLTGKGVSYCGTCDAPFYRGQEVVVVGGGDSALTETLFIAKFARHITLVHRKERFRAVRSLVQELEKLPQITRKMNCEVEEIIGNNSMESVEAARIMNRQTGQSETLSVNGVFIFVGLLPVTSFLDSSILDSQGYVLTDEKMQTSLPGLYAAGDVRSNTFRQIVCAAADGAKAAHFAGEYLEKLSGNPYQSLK